MGSVSALDGCTEGVMGLVSPLNRPTEGVIGSVSALHRIIEGVISNVSAMLLTWVSLCRGWCGPSFDYGGCITAVVDATTNNYGKGITGDGGLPILQPQSNNQSFQLILSLFPFQQLLYREGERKIRDHCT